jgi:hypothetical protein
MVLLAAIAGRALGADDFRTYPEVEIGLGASTLALSALVALSGLAPLKRRVARKPTADGTKSGLSNRKLSRRREVARV